MAFFFCKAYKEGMIFPKYVWMLIGWYSEKWYLEGDDAEVCNHLVSFKNLPEPPVYSNTIRKCFKITKIIKVLY